MSKIKKYNNAIDHLSFDPNFKHQLLAKLTSKPEHCPLDHINQLSLHQKSSFKSILIITSNIALFLLLSGCLFGLYSLKCHQTNTILSKQFDESTTSYTRSIQLMEDSKQNTASSSRITGYDIIQSQISDNELSLLKEQNISSQDSTIYYQADYEQNSSINSDEILFNKYCGTEKLWSITLTDITILGYYEYSNKVIIYGFCKNASNNKETSAKVVAINNNGTVLWEKVSASDQNQESYTMAVCEDSKIILLGINNRTSLCFTTYDWNGSMLSSQSNTLEDYSTYYTILKVTRIPDGYLVLIGENSNWGNQILKLNNDGLLLHYYSFIEDDSDFYITDVKQYNNRLYVSAYTTPKVNPPATTGGHSDMYGIDKQIDLDKFVGDNTPISEDMSEAVKNHFSAILIICDTKTFVPTTFLTTKESIPSSLTLNEKKQLIWNVNNIINATFSPYTSSKTYDINCLLFEYTFDQSNKLVKQVRTEELTHFIR